MSPESRYTSARCQPDIWPELETGSTETGYMSFRKEYHSPCGTIHLYLGDNKDLMNSDQNLDLAIVDPPYGINAPEMRMGSAPTRKEKGNYPAESTTDKIRKGRLNKGSGKLKNRLLNESVFDWDSAIPDESYFTDLKAISNNQIIFGGNYFNLPPTRCMVCWDKMQPWENFSQFELAWTSFDEPAVMIRVSNTGGNNQEFKFHPTQKPVKLYEEIIRRLVDPYSKIIDTHGGSMGIAIAVHKANLLDDMNLSLNCIEIDEIYFDLAVARFQAYIAQLSIFETPLNK